MKGEREREREPLPLRLHSPYSFYEGAAWAEQLAEEAARRGHEALAITDRNRVSGLVRGARAAREHGLRFVPGLLLDDPRDEGRHILFWAVNLEGYGSLCRLASRRQLEEGFRLERAADEPGPGVIAATADPHLLEVLRERLARDSLFAELPHFRDGEGRRTALEAYEASRRLGIGRVATANVACARPEQLDTVQLLRAVGKRQVLRRAAKEGRTGPALAYSQMGEVARRFEGVPDALDASRLIAERTGVDLRLGELKFPEPDLPGGADPFEELKRRGEEGLRRRYGPAPPTPARKRLAYELAVTERLGFTGYMLVVHDIAQRAWARGVRTLGRGSAANSIICYVLGLTDICPLKYDLYFERFLNPERSSPPDIDLDFSWRDRDEILDGVYDSHGHERVAMIATTVTFGARAALREAALARGLPEEEITPVTRMVPHFAHPRSITMLHEEVAECRELPLGRDPWRSIAADADRLLHLPRHLSIHAGGIVITRGPITDWTGLERASKGFVVTQYDMYSTEDLGLVKIDLLSQRSLGVLKDAAAMVRENRGGSPPPVDDVETVFNDPATRSLLANGDTMGVFYTESPGMLALNRKLSCDSFDLLVAASSVIRPGVSESGMMQQYIERVNDPAKAHYLHPIMERLLGETHGVMIYQEDVIKVAHHLAGLSLGRADLLRRAMSGKTRSYEAMAELEREFLDGCRNKGVEEETAREVWRQIESFAGYSFCKAHSASFAVLSMQIAYLKAHHPAEFFAAVLANGGGYYSQAAYVEEAKRVGLEVLLPCVNASGVEHRGRGSTIRLGLAGVGSLRRESPERIVAEREQAGPYRGLEDFCARVQPTSDEAEALVACGAFDAFPGNRPTRLRTLRAGFEALLNSPGPLAAGGDELFAEVPDAPPWSDRESYLAERRVLGFSPGHHPLALLDLPREGAVPAREMERHVGRQVAMVGWIYSHKRIKTRKTRRNMEFMSMEDLTGSFEVTLFPRVYDRHAPLLRSHPHGPYRVLGRVEEDHGVFTLTASRLELLAVLSGDRGSARRRSGPGSSRRPPRSSSAGREGG